MEPFKSSLIGPPVLGPSSSETFATMTVSSLTAGRVTFAGTAGLLSDSANLTYTDGTTTGQLVVPVGAVGTPSLTFTGDTDTGLYHPAANQLGLTTNGALALLINASQTAAFTPTARTSGVASYFTVTAPADTGQTTATESIGVNINSSATRTWVDGTVATQREVLVQAPTYNKTTTSATFTNASTLAVSGAPIAGAGVTITNPNAISVGSGRITLNPAGGTTSADGVWFGTDTNLYRSAAGQLVMSKPTTGVADLQILSADTYAQLDMTAGGAGQITWRVLSGFPAAGDYSIRENAAGFNALTFNKTTGNAQLNGKVTTYNNVATNALGFAAIYKKTRITAQSSNGTIATYANPAVDGSFEVSANMNVTASTTLVTTITCTYTDESNTSRTLVMPVAPLSGTWATAGAISGAGATVWHTGVMHIRCKASTSITLATTAGTFTGVTFTAEGIIKQTD